MQEGLQNKPAYAPTACLWNASIHKNGCFSASLRWNSSYSADWPF